MMFRVRHLLPAVLCASLLIGCGVNQEQIDTENYIDAMEEIGTVLDEAGTKLETLMNVQHDALAWTSAEKAELATALDSLRSAEIQAANTATPEYLADAHTGLIEGLQQMQSAVETIQTIANDPTTISEEMLDEMSASVDEASSTIDTYLETVTTLIGQKFPEIAAELEKTDM